MKIDLVNYLKEYFNRDPGYRPDLLSLKEYLPLKLQSQFSDNIDYDVMKKLLIEFDINDIDDDKDEDTDEFCVTNSSNTLSDMLSFFYLIDHQLTSDPTETKPPFSDVEVSISNRLFYLHKFIVTHMCPSILCDEHNMFLNNLPSELTYVLLKWIYSGEINVEDISFDNLFILYELFVNIIKNDEVKKYLNGIINDRITG